MTFPGSDSWFIVLSVLGAALLLSVIAALFFRRNQKKKEARITFILFIIFLLTFASLFFYFINYKLPKPEKGKYPKLEERIRSAEERKGSKD